MDIEKTTEKKSGIPLRMWMVFIIIGLAGQFAWSVENMYLNTYITYLNFTDKTGIGFNYSLMIAITTACSAIVAMLTTIFMGALTDRIGHKKLFISVGYSVWGIATASFGLLNVNSDNDIIKISMSAFTAAVMVVVIDCLMTYFGSTANDASFNSYVTSHTDDSNRSKVEGVLGILPLVSMLFIFVGLNGLTTKDNGYRWDIFFYIIGGLVFLVGILSFFLLPKEKEKTNSETYVKLLVDGFKPKTVKTNKKLYLILLVYFIFSTACQVYFPYLMTYIEYSCSIANSGSSFLTPFAIVMAIALIGGSALSVVFGFLSDKVGRNKMIIPSLMVFALGLLLMFFIPTIASDTMRMVYGAIACLLMILGFVGVPTVINALVREYIPKGREGSFMGVRMLFVVALPMCIGPFIGDAFNGVYGKPHMGDYGVVSNLPSSFGYLMAFALVFLTLIPLYFYFKELKKGTDEHAQ